MDLEKLGNIFGAETIKKIYEDGISGSVQEAGKMLTDFIKTARLFTAPFQLSASYQDRLSKYFEKVRDAVPEENQIPAPASLSGPIIERLKYLGDDNYLTDLYLNLLKRAIDKERVNEAHPAFRSIIDQISPDEAMLLYLLNQNYIQFDYIQEHIKDENGKLTQWGAQEVVVNTPPKEKLVFLENFDMYIHHLDSLNLTTWTVENQHAIYDGKIQTHAKTKTVIQLTDFGALFVKACIPPNGFIIVGGEN